jgi:putative MATE family efflux protein
VRPLDREIARLAVPALGALIAEPLYILADTAVVGHLGTPELAGLAVASSVLLTAHALCTFLAYGTTAAVSRLLGAGEQREAAHQAIQGLWLAAGLGTLLAVVGWIAAPTLVGWLGAEGEVAEHAELYLVVSLPGLPAILAVLAGTGYLRGLQDTRTPLVVAVVSGLANLVFELVLIYGFGFGLGASALTTVVAQWGAALVYVRGIGGAARRLGVALAPHLHSVRRLLRVGGALVVRTLSLRAALVIATAVAARIGTADVGAHLVVFELWNMLALALDALAIAGQSLIGWSLGAADVERARTSGRRLLELGVMAGFLAALLIVVLRTVLPDVFTDDPEVAELAAFLLWWVALLQPVNAVVFVLDGLLIGAGDMRFLALAMPVALAVFGACATVVLVADAGIGWLWAALGAFMVARLVPLLVRWSSGKWAVVGAVR